VSQQAQILITWTEPFEVNVQFPPNPILCEFMLAKAARAVVKHFETPPSLITPATMVPPSLEPGR
jgi:hypothetical protein